MKGEVVKISLMGGPLFNLYRQSQLQAETESFKKISSFLGYAPDLQQVYCVVTPVDVTQVSYLSPSTS